MQHVHRPPNQQRAKSDLQLMMRLESSHISTGNHLPQAISSLLLSSAAQPTCSSAHTHQMKHQEHRHHHHFNYLRNLNHHRHHLHGVNTNTNTNRTHGGFLPLQQYHNNLSQPGPPQAATRQGPPRPVTLASYLHREPLVNQSRLISGSSEAAVTAMMMVSVRLTLVILISVLLVKLFATSPSKSSSNMSSSRAKRQRVRRSSFIDEEFVSNDTEKTESQQNELKQLSHQDYSSKGPVIERILANFPLLTRARKQIDNYQQQQQQLPKRRQSEPEIKLATGNSSNSQSHQRHRRYSDTCLTHLNLPPGPMGLPFLGYLPFVGSEIHLTLTSLSERYGPIYQIHLGGIRVVVLNDASLVRQAFKQPVFSGRPDTQLTRILQGYGIVNSDGALWKEQRAFLHSALRKLGAKSLMSGANGLEAKIQNQVKEFINDLSSQESKAFQVRPIIVRAVSSVVGSIVMNLTYRKFEEKEKFDRLIELMQEGFRLVSIAMPLDFIPILRFLPGVSYAYKKMKRNRAETSAFFKGIADDHRQYLSRTFNLSAGFSETGPRPLHPHPSLSGQPKPDNRFGNSAQQQQQPQQQQQQQQLEQLEIDNKGPATPPLDTIIARDLVDAYLLQQKKHETDGKENYFSDQQLVQIMSDIFSAGLETVTSTIEWSMLFLILNVECQDRVQEEIDRVIGRHRMPKLEDLSSMPYTEATIWEVLRRSNVVALGNAHATLDDASIGGYLIPKGTQVLPNLYGIHMNPKLWDQPDRFDPNRFIVQDRAHKPDYFMPFSVGRRMCLGDVLAKMEVFLFLVGTLQHYNLRVHDDDRNSPPQVKGTIGISNSPAYFRVAVHQRADTPAGGYQ